MCGHRERRLDSVLITLVAIEILQDLARLSSGTDEATSRGALVGVGGMTMALLVYFGRLSWDHYRRRDGS